MESREVKCNTCGAMVPRNEIHDNGHTIWTEDDRYAYPNVCGPVEDILDAEYIED